MSDSRDVERAFRVSADAAYLKSNGVVQAFQDLASELKTNHGYAFAEVEIDHPDRPDQVALKYCEKPSGIYSNSDQSVKTHTYLLDRITGRVLREVDFASVVHISGRMGSGIFPDPSSKELGIFLLEVALQPVVFERKTPIQRRFTDSPEKGSSMMIERNPRGRGRR